MSSAYSAAMATQTIPEGPSSITLAPGPVVSKAGVAGLRLGDGMGSGRAAAAIVAMGGVLGWSDLI